MRYFLGFLGLYLNYFSFFELFKHFQFIGFLQTSYISSFLLNFLRSFNLFRNCKYFQYWYGEYSFVKYVDERISNPFYKLIKILVQMIFLMKTLSIIFKYYLLSFIFIEFLELFSIGLSFFISLFNSLILYQIYH